MPDPKQDDTKQDPEVPVYLDPLIGWRTWSLPTPSSPHRDPWAVVDLADQSLSPRDDGPLELVTGNGTKWPQRERLTAACRAGRSHRSPDPACRCGIYAATSHRVLRARGYAAGPEDNRAPDLVGELWMWGRVMQSGEILRAEFAYPKRLFLPFSTWKRAKPLGDLYGVPVVLKNPFTMDPDNPDKEAG